MRRCATSTTRSGATRNDTQRSSATCSRAGSTSRRASSRRCSSRSHTMTTRSTARSRRLQTSQADSLWDTIAAEAGVESPLWTAALRPLAEQERAPVFSTLGEPRYALGIETIYEGYLLHYGRPRLFAPDDADTSLLLGDYLYAHGLVRIEQVGTVEAVNDLAELIALCAYLQADGIAGEGAVWAATSSLLGRGALDDARNSLRLDNDPNPLERLARAAAGDEAVMQSLAAHRARL